MPSDRWKLHQGRTWMPAHDSPATRKSVMAEHRGLRETVTRWVPRVVLDPTTMDLVVVWRPPEERAPRSARVVKG